MRTMTPATREKILAAVEKVADAVQNGDAPNAAIIKVARDAQMHPGHIDMLVRAYNTGRTLEQVDEGDLQDKIASFPLADSATVLDALYPENVKTASALRAEVVVSDDYSLPPSRILSVMNPVNTEPLVKVAEAPPSTGPSWSELRKQADDAKRPAEDLRRKVADTADRLHVAFEKVAACLKGYGSPNFPDVKDALTTMWGHVGTAICNELERRTPYFSKQASCGKVVKVDPAAEPWKSLHAIKADALAFEDLRSKYAAARLHEENLRATLKIKTAGLIGTVGNAAAFNGTNSLLRGIAGAVGSDSANVNKTLSKLTDPAHQQQLREIQVRAHLDDLMANDPVISAHDPAEVLATFNDLSEIGGPAIGNRIALQSLLRKALQQNGLDTFELDQVASLGNKMQPRSSLMQSMMGAPSGQTA